jgi:uncharacterized protein YqeY
MKSKDEVGTATTRLTIAALKERDINARGQGREAVDDSEILSMLQGMVKQRQESIKIYTDAKRPDLADREAAEVRVIETFLPKQMSESEAEAAVAGLITELGVTSIKDMGRVMAELKTRFAGQMDMARASGMVKSKLAA